jgi:hypothetical protein
MQDIRPLFRDQDIDDMLFAFDLSKVEDVRANAPGIYERLSDGTMPCYGPWPDEQIAKFKEWMDGGMAP